MKARVEWSDPVRDAIFELPLRVQEEIFRKIDLLELFPRMYRTIEKGRWRRHRRFLAADWFVYYRVVDDTVYIRGLWPARMQDLPRR